MLRFRRSHPCFSSSIVVSDYCLRHFSSSSCRPAPAETAVFVHLNPPVSSFARISLQLRQHDREQHHVTSGKNVVADCFDLLVDCCRALGSAMALGTHRHLIDVAAAKIADELPNVEQEVCKIQNAAVARSFAVCLTTLEQAYHWPEHGTMCVTPEIISNLKFVVLYSIHPELQAALLDDVSVSSASNVATNDNEVVEYALGFAEKRIAHARRLLGDSSNLLLGKQQRLVNLLFRTVHEDVFGQQPMVEQEEKKGAFLNDRYFMEFGALHEAVATNGMMRLMNEKFERSGGVSATLVLAAEITSCRSPGGGSSNSSSNRSTCSSLLTLQRCVTSAVAPLMLLQRWDVPIWAATYLRFSKAVPPGQFDGTGLDTAAIHFLDAVLGHSSGARFCCAAAGGAPLQTLSSSEGDGDDTTLVRVHKDRAAYFPPSVTDALDRVCGARIRETMCEDEKMNRNHFLAFAQQYRHVLETHRKMALGILIALQTSGLESTAAGFGNSAGAGSAGNEDVENATSLSIVHHADAALRGSLKARFGNSDGADGSSLTLSGVSAAILEQFGTAADSRGSLIRLCVPAPLILEHGDRIRVRVEGASSTDGERTFSVIRARIVDDGGMMKTFVDIAVRDTLSAETVAHALCCCCCCGGGGDKMFAVRACPTPRNHIRLCKHQQQQQEHITFIAAGTAVCSGIEWLVDNISTISGGGVVGGSVTIIAVANSLSQVPLREKLLRIVKEHAGRVSKEGSSHLLNVRIVFVLGQQQSIHPSDHGEHEAVHIHHGRIEDFLCSEETNGLGQRIVRETTHGLVTGGSPFGVAVARALYRTAANQGAGAGQLRLRSGKMHNPRHPVWRYDVYSRSSNSRSHNKRIGALPLIPRRKIALCNHIVGCSLKTAQQGLPSPSLMIIDGHRVVDVEPLFPMHPGGEKQLGQFLGLDASDMFAIVHCSSSSTMMMSKKPSRGGGCPFSRRKSCSADCEAIAFMEACTVGRCLPLEKETPEEQQRLKALSALVSIQNTAVNNSRCHEWPNSQEQQQKQHLGPITFPPLHFIRHGLTRFAEQLKEWQATFCGGNAETERAAEELRQAVVELERRTDVWIRREIGSATAARATEPSAAPFSGDEEDDDEEREESLPEEDVSRRIAPVIFESRADLWESLHEAFDALLKEPLVAFDLPSPGGAPELKHIFLRFVQASKTLIQKHVH